MKLREAVGEGTGWEELEQGMEADRSEYIVFMHEITKEYIMKTYYIQIQLLNMPI